MLKELRVKGDERKKVIDALLGRGIQKMDQLAAMDCLADRIFSSLWDNIESTEHGTVFKSLKSGYPIMTRDTMLTFVCQTDAICQALELSDYSMRIAQAYKGQTRRWIWNTRPVS